MSVDLNIWANHQLAFSSAKEGISSFEEMTQKTVKHWNRNTDDPLTTTTKNEQIEFFTNEEMLENNFQKWNQIRIATNFHFCDEISIYKHSLKVHPKWFKTRFSEWKKFITQSYKNEAAEYRKLMEGYDQNWQTFRQFCHLIIPLLGGTRVLYIDDHGFQLQEDKFYEGLPFDSVWDLLSKAKEPLELEYLQLFPNDFLANYTWYYEEL